jgi:hypothetical protein
MEFFKKRSDVFFRGVGAEFVFKTADGISLVSGGKILKLRLVGPNGDEINSRIVLEEPDGRQHVIFEGGAVAASAKLVEISDEATSKRTVVTSGRKGIYTVLAAFTAVYLIFCHPGPGGRPSPEIQAASSELDELIKAIPSVAGTPSLQVPALQPPVSNTSSLPSVASPVLDRPSFLSLPEDEVAATAPEITDEVEIEEAPLPKYTPDLYSSSPAPDGKVSAVTEAQSTSETAAVVPEVAPSETGAEALVSPAAAPAEIKAAEVTPAEPTATSVDVAVTTPASEPVAETSPSGATEAVSEVAAAPETPVEDSEAAAKAAKEAAKNMSPQETAALLQQLEQMMEMDPAAITPAMLAKLPHEIAQTLRNSGVIGNPNAIPERGDAPYAAIRLPEGVIDKYRGKDGIPSIPENDTFAALGNKIPLQLPGGGDIRTPEDLRLFGFEP